MLDAVPVVSRQLMVIDPSEECEELLASIEASGWAVRFGSLDDIAAQSSDVVLIHLHDATPQALQRLIGHLRGGSASWVAVFDSWSQFQDDLAVFAGEWFFAMHALPCDSGALLESLALAQIAARLRNQQARNQSSQFIGNSVQARQVRSQLERYARMDVPLLLTGERGTGKALLARLLHEGSSRARRAFAYFDCTGHTPEQLAARLFGVVDESDGMLALAKTGTLVLEGVAELPTDIQQRLRSYLQAHRTLRLLTISQGEVEVAAREGRLHDDLYRLLAGLRLQTFALREHRSDQMLLAEYFARLYGASIGRRPRYFSEEAMHAIGEYTWPGNVRELCNRVLRALVLAQGRQILARDLGLLTPAERDGSLGTLEDYILHAERQALTDVLARYSSNMSQAARSLGVSRPTFYRLLHKHQFR